MTHADQPTRACNICGRTGGHDPAPDDFVSIAARERWAAGPGGRIAALEAEVGRLRRAFELASDSGTSAVADCDCAYCEDTRLQMREHWLIEAGSR